MLDPFYSQFYKKNTKRLAALLVPVLLVSMALPSQARPKRSKQNAEAKHRSSIAGTLTLGTLGAMFLLNYYADPSYALFFAGAEEFLKGAPGISVASAAVTLVFNVLRGLFLLYVGLALVTTVNALRQDEDWQSVARTPLLVALAVGVSDVVTNLIVK